MSLADIRVIVGVMFYRYPVYAWLDDFESWCRRLWFLRQNYGETQNYIYNKNIYITS